MTTTSPRPRTTGSPRGRAAVPVAPARGRLRPLSLHRVTLKEGVWGTAQAANAGATLQHCVDWMERLGWIANFDRVRDGRTGGERPGWNFSDSEIYKLLEALAWEAARTGEVWVDDLHAALSQRVAAAQDPDGYLNTCYGHAGQEPRWSDLPEGHELYCLGHLLQAAAARYRTRGDDLLVDVARRAADLVCREFGVDGQQAVCGHPEIEVGLVELGRALGEAAYVDQARLFLDRRGHGTLGEGKLGRAYFQDDVPIREATALRGHAVRALYLQAAAVDVAVDDADDELLEVLQRQWRYTVERRTYLTGGMGSRHQDEGFGDDWELPCDRAYCETCAGIASLMVSWRLLLATGDVEHADLMERTLYNVLATGVAEDGRSFYYANTLHQRVAGEVSPTDAVSPRAESATRAPWFDVSCCPTNIARTMSSLGCYVATTDDTGVQLHQYAAGEVTAELPQGLVRLRVRTRYPLDGHVAVGVDAAPDVPVTLRLRVPSWADGARLTSPDGPPDGVGVTPGWVTLERVWSPGDVVVLELPMTARLTAADPRVDAVRGCLAVERGPEVWCLESRRLPEGVELDAVVLDGATSAPGAHEVTATLRERGDDSQTYLDVDLVPYRTWGAGGPTAMRIWVPTF